MMAFNKVAILFLLLGVMVSIASAVDFNAPINTFTYETPNILFDISDETNDTVLCNITYNDVLTNQTFRNDTVSYYLEDVQAENTILLSCNDSTSESISFYYDSGETVEDIALWIIPMIFLIFGVLLFILFKK